MHRRNRTPCTFSADKGEKKKVLAQPGREEEEGGGGGGGGGRHRAADTGLLAPASMAKGGWEPGAPVYPSRPGLVASRNQAAMAPLKMPHGLPAEPCSGPPATTSPCRPLP